MSSNFYRDNEKIDKQIIDQIKKDNVTYENLNNDDFMIGFNIQRRSRT